MTNIVISTDAANLLISKRRELGLTRVKFAEIHGYSINNIVNWELGRTIPTWGIIPKLVRDYRLTEEEELALYRSFSK